MGLTEHCFLHFPMPMGRHLLYPALILFMGLVKGRNGTFKLGDKWEHCCLLGHTPLTANSSPFLYGCLKTKSLQCKLPLGSRSGYWKTVFRMVALNIVYILHDKR